MQLVQVDVVGLQRAQAQLDGAHHVATRPGGVVDLGRAAELGGDDHLVALGLQRLTHELLGLAAAVHARRVEEGDAGVDGRVEHLDGAVVVDAHAEVVAAETGNRHPQS